METETETEAPNAISVGVCGLVQTLVIDCMDTLSPDPIQSTGSVYAN